MNRYAPVILSILLLASCGMRHAGIVMDDVETYVQEAPDSARLSLQDLPARSHWLPWQHARYCLLLSSALDRCGVEVQDDSLTRYAADYYDYFGTPVNRFLSQYYLGRVHENRGDRQSAMDAFVKAESITSDKVPLRFRCALEMHMGAIYSQIYDLNRAKIANGKAAKFARNIKWWEAYGEALLKNETMFISEGEWNRADSCRCRLDSIRAYLPIWQILTMRGNDSRRLLNETGDFDKVCHYNDSIILAFEANAELIPWEYLSKTYVRSGHPEKALNAILRYSEYNDTETNSIFYATLSEVLDSLNDLRRSLDAYKRYIEISDSLDLVIFNEDTKFAKERYALQSQVSRRRTAIRIITLLSAVIIAWLAFYMVKRKKEQRHLEALYADLKEEFIDLQNLPIRQSDLSQQASDLLGGRFKALAAFFTKDPPKSLNSVSTQLETLAENRKDLLETIGLLFAIYRPDFVLHLVDKGLTTAETGYCCLIALGLRNGEMKDVINREGVNNINSSIRRKLELRSNSSKLGTVLRALYGNETAE